MIIPSIDLKFGKAIQLVSGKGNPQDEREPISLSDELSVLGIGVLVDLDRAFGIGDNIKCIKEIVNRHPEALWRIGGGLRNKEAVQEILNISSNVQVILGTLATSDFLSQFPKEKIVAAVDHDNGKLVTHGWSQQTNISIQEKVDEVSKYVSAIHLTHAPASDTLAGLGNYTEIKSNVPIVLAGGIGTLQDIKQATKDVIVGKAFRGNITLGEAFTCTLEKRTYNELYYPTIIVQHNQVLGLAWSTSETLQETINSRKVVLFSRKRGRWVKGESSGNIPKLLTVKTDCDNDAILISVDMNGKPWCHTGKKSCWKI